MSLAKSFYFLIALSLLSSLVMAKKKASGPSKYEHLDLFSRVLDIVEKQYYREVSSEKLIEGAIQGMLQTLDPHSRYLDKTALKKMKSDSSGKFGGLGVEVTSKDGVILVITPFEGTPAFRAGIKSGDRIVEIEQESIQGMALDEAVKRMRGKPGSKVTIGLIRRDSDKIEYITLVREVIKIRPVKSELLQDKYAYIRLAQFQADSASDIQKHLQKLAKKAKGLRGIVFDLRSNPGGLLDEAVKVSSIFLKEGIVVSTEARDPKQKEVRTVLKSGHKDTKTPLIVLINGSSASASEIVAGALKDHKRAIIMGNRSFGKGSVQTVLDVADNKGIKLTIQQYMTPKGTKIQAKGIVPDIELPEFSVGWIEQVENDPIYLREQDLRNHISATIETPEEKKQRLQREKEYRIQRQKKIAEKREKAKEKKDSDNSPRSFDPKSDFQVHSAINYLKSFDFYQRFRSSTKAPGKG